MIVSRKSGQNEELPAGRAGMKRFDKALQVSAVKMVIEEGQKASEVDCSLGIHTNMVYR